MSSKRKASNVSFTYNSNDSKLRTEAKGTKPLPSPISVGGAMINAVLFGCRKFMFFNTNLRIAGCVALIFISFIFDYSPLPRSYFSQSSNVFNQFFVKLGWAWTLLLTVPFVLLSSITYCCGNYQMVGRHLSRLGIATAVWWTATTSFIYFENNTGSCSVKGDKFANKYACLKGGHFWHSIDISGHAFILIYSTLVIIEETKAILGWESIADLIRNEKYHRSNSETDLSSPLKQLTSEEFQNLTLYFTKYSPYVKASFIGLTCLTLIWHLMVISTVLYFHIMIEKLVGAAVAISIWFITYRYWYSKTSLLPCSPGVGLFQYFKVKNENSTASKNSTATLKSRPELGPTFMGMPLYSNKVDDVIPTNKTNNTKVSLPNNIRNGPLTRSQARLDTSL